MAQPFYMEYETRYNKMQGCIDSYKQFMNIKKHMRDEKTGLYYHGYDESRQMYWADPETGCSPNFWLRAMGWFLVAMVDVLERMDEQLYNEYRGIMAMLKQAVEDMHKFQDEQTGMFWQAVSYTHLDVYKRQASCSPSPAPRRATSGTRTSTRGRCGWTAPISVSYTHLDVYKRQPLYRAGCSGFFAWIAEELPPQPRYTRQSLQQAVYRLIYQFVAFCERN